MLGIDQNTWLTYEGSPSLFGHAVWPAPFVSTACYIGQLAEWDRASANVTFPTSLLIFCEDSFDPVARVRRGRLYEWYSRNPCTWHVQQHPAYASFSRNVSSSPNALEARGFQEAELLTYRPWIVSEAFLAKQQESVLVLGAGTRLTAHSVLDVERLASGEELITIRTRASLGVLPDLIGALIPERHATLVVDQYEKAASAAFRDDAESVIDRCREAASAALHAYTAAVKPESNIMGKDLSDLADLVDPPNAPREQRRLILGNAARIIARLHAQGKSAERVKRGNDAPSESDAECTLALLGKIYRDLGWAR